MISQYAFLIFIFIDSYGAHQADIDINRLLPLPNDTQHFYTSPYYIHGRRSLNFDQFRRNNDYDDHSAGLFQPHSIMYPVPTPYPKNTVKVHQPRENPRLYYQSDAYIKEYSSKNVDREVTAIYPGQEVIRFDGYDSPSLLPRKTRNKKRRIYPVRETCIRCPRDRTLVVKMGSDRVVLQAPHLISCSGQRVSNNVRFNHMYGPKFGSFVTRGSHVIVGRITLNNQNLHLCKMEVNVIVQSCPVPKYLVSHCDVLNKSCNFSCKDSRLEIQGDTSLVCGNNMEWDNDLPVCRARRWCHTPIPPENGRISCKGNHVGEGAGLEEGSKCRIRCASGSRPHPRGVTVCRRGIWTHKPQCQPKNKYPKG